MPIVGDILEEIELATSVFSGLGGFWTTAYSGRDQVYRYCRAITDLSGQLGDDVEEAMNCIARETVPIHRRFRWRSLIIRRGDRTSSAATVLRYSDPRADAKFGGGYFYGAPGVLGEVSYAHDGVADVAIICSRLEAPGTVLVAGVDFTVGPERIVFRVDPFDDPSFAVKSIDGDDELVLWMFRPGYDDGFVRDYVGFQVGLSLPSSLPYREACNATLDAVAGGTAVAQLSRALAAATGTPTAGVDGETVETIGSDFGRPFVATDRAVYRLGVGAAVSVAVGDVLAAGDPLGDGFTLAEFNRGVAPSWLMSVSLDAAVLSPGAGLEVVFPRGAVPTEVRIPPPHLPQYTELRFPLGGRDEDVEAFWRSFHARGVATGKTLAMCLDRRPRPAAGQPTAGSLPATIDPLEFLVANVLRGNAAAIRIRPAAFGADAIGLGSLAMLRRISPPHVLLLVVVEVEAADDSAILDPDDGAEVGVGIGTDPFDEPCLSGDDESPVPGPRQTIDFS